MAQANIYSEKALEHIMDPKFVDACSKGDVYNLDSQYLKLDYCIELDCPEYTGPRLEKDLLELLKKRFGSLLKLKIKRNTKRDSISRFQIDIIENCKKALDSESAIYVESLLPYHIIDNIVIGKDPKTNQFISPEKKFSEIPLGTIMYAPNDGNKWYALVLGSFRNMTRDDTHTPTSMLTMVIRHLERIGYTPIVIQYHDWNKLSSEKEKQMYIMDLLRK